jgi:hypothetical protein
MKPVSYEQHCNRCHRLTFDDSRPDVEARHGEPREVYADLVRIYQLDEGRMGSLRQRRRRIVRDSRADLGLAVNAGIRRQVEEAENHVYRSACVTCHKVDLDVQPYPSVARSRIQRVWLPLSHFDHGKHLEAEIKRLTCETCHAQARASTPTADVLLPGIAACGGCHGGSSKPPGEAALEAGRNDCVGCHAYHLRKEEGKR